MAFPRDAFVPLRRKRDLLKTCSLVVLIGLPLLWWLELWGGETTTLSALALYLPQHYYLVGPLVLGVWALCKRRFRLVLLNGTSLAFCLFFPLGLHLHFPQTKSGKTVRLVTFNVERGENDLSKIKAALAFYHPDIICLQESGRSGNLDRNAIGDIVARSFPTWNMRFAGDVATLSRFPVVEEHVYPLKGTRRTLETVLQTPQGKVRLLNTHISTTFKGSRWFYSTLDYLVLLCETAQPSAQTRLDQLPAIRAAINGGDAKLPLVLAGDFNSPPRGHFYAGLARDLNDAFADVGNGTGTSFPARFPVLRIDYVWTRGAKARRAFVGETSGSDHRPMIADMEMGSS